LSADAAASAMDETWNYEDSVGRIVAVFGKSYHADGIPYVIDGIFYQYSGEEYHLRFNFLSEDRGKPPSVIKPPETLLAIAIESASSEPHEVVLNATFKYPGEDGLVSGLVIPFQMPVPLRPARGIRFTQIDGVRLSNVDDHEIKDSVQVRVAQDGEIIQDVWLKRMRKINTTFIRSLFKESSRVSSNLVTKQEEISSDN
jgi:hypothetical protein